MSFLTVRVAMAPMPLVLPEFYRKMEFETAMQKLQMAGGVHADITGVSFKEFLMFCRASALNFPQHDVVAVLEAYRTNVLGQDEFDVDTMIEEREGRETGLFLAIYCSKPYVADWFLTHGADPTKEPEHTWSYPPPRYITTHMLKRAMRNGMPIWFIEKLLARGAPTDPSPKTVFFRKNIFEFVLIDCRMLHTDFMVGYMKALLAGSTAIPSATVVDTLYEAFFYDGMSPNYPKEILYDLLGQLMWREAKEEIMATRIQRYWRSFRMRKATIAIQRAVRTKIWHPDHLWGNGKTTVQNMFGKEEWSAAKRMKVAM
jgi:hypothetical protein